MSRRLTASDLTAHLGYWLRFVSNHVSHAFAQKLAAMDVTVAEWVLMRALYSHEAVSPSAIATEMGMTRGAVTKLADRLIVKQLVVRAANPSDGRAQTLALTPAGQGIVPTLAALADQNDTEFFGHLTADEEASLRRILKEIIERRGLTSLPID